MSIFTKQRRQTSLLQLLSGVCFAMLSACGSTPDKVLAPTDTQQSFSTSRVVHTDHSMITLLDPADLTHHQGEPANWYLHDFAIEDDLQTGRFAAVLTGRSGKFNVRITFGELTEAESAVAGAEAKLRLRVVNHRLLLSGGDAWPSEETDYRKFAHDARWISVPNGDYGVIITALQPGAAQSDYVFQLIRVNDITKVKHAPGVPKLVYGKKASVVGVNSKGFEYSEQCLDMPAKASWAPLAVRTMPIPGKQEPVELPKSMHTWALEQQQQGRDAALPVVLSRNPEVGAYGFYLKPGNWSKAQIQTSGAAMINTLIWCAVEITDIEATPSNFALRFKAMPTASDRLSSSKKKQLVDAFDRWLRAKNDRAWLFKLAKTKRSTNDGAMILGIVESLKLSSKESEKLLPMSNALRVDYLLERFDQF